jgi:predicted DNA-binding transcriptional regulator YafY
LLEGHPRGFSLEELANTLNVTTRSVRRYLKELAKATELESIPTLPGAAHEWRIKPSERGRAVALRRTQAYGLLAPRAVFDIFKGSALYDELDIGLGMIATLAQRPTRGRAGGDIPTDQRFEDRFCYVPFPPRGYAGRGELLDELFRAVAESRETKARVASSADRFTLHPYALVVFRGELYCIGKHLERERVEVFPFDRIAEAVPNEKRRFVVPEDFRLEAYVHGPFGVHAPEALQRVTVEFDVQTAPEIRSRKWHATQRLATAPDGRVRLTFLISDLDAVLPWVLGYGQHARVIEPAPLVASVEIELRRALQRYDAP